MESRVAVLEEIARSSKSAWERIERHLDEHGSRLERRIDEQGTRLERRIDDLGRRIDGVSKEHHADFRWLLGLIIGLFATMLAGFSGLLGVMAHGFHRL
jgi:hypothetical protein